MKRVSLRSVVQHCNRLLQPEAFDDWPGAVNGLQVENEGKITRIAAAVDATAATVRRALALQADLLIVHHGLFWGPSHPWTGKRYELIQSLVQGNLAVYSAHLPLDAHPRLGNNIQLCRALRLRDSKPFFLDRGAHLGIRTRSRLSRSALADRLAAVLGAAPKVIPGGPETCGRIGIVTGGAGSDLARIAAEGIDTFITGEGPHWTFALAEELEVNVFYGGHYATETFGVKALAEHLSQKFGVPWRFIDYPTGL